MIQISVDLSKWKQSTNCWFMFGILRSALGTTLLVTSMSGAVCLCYVLPLDRTTLISWSFPRNGIIIITILVELCIFCLINSHTRFLDCLSTVFYKVRPSKYAESCMN